MENKKLELKCETFFGFKADHGITHSRGIVLSVALSLKQKYEYKNKKMKDFPFLFRKKNSIQNAVRMITICLCFHYSLVNQAESVTVRLFNGYFDYIITVRKNSFCKRLSECVPS